MPKYQRPTSYMGPQSNQNTTGSVRAANSVEAVDGVSEQLYISPATLVNAAQIVASTSLTNVSSPYSVLLTDYLLSCDSTAGILTVTLPNAATTAGKTYVIRDAGGLAATNNITIATAGGNLLGGGASSATKVLNANYSGATVYSNGVDWLYAFVA